jgi:hypothetical protein
METEPQIDLHSHRPSAYLDQWVWIRLARAAAGETNAVDEVPVLEAVARASECGVAFPLSSTHYIETSKIGSERQRFEVGGLMSAVTHVRTLRPRHELLRHQILGGLHELFGRPTFRPEYLEPLGTGSHWAFTGRQHRLEIHLPADAPSDLVAMIQSDLPPDEMCRAMQWGEREILSGPHDVDRERLRREFGYRPETAEQIEADRLSWEQTYVDLLHDDPVARQELRVRVQAREVVHEHLDLLHGAMDEYGIPFGWLTGPADEPGSGRERMVPFFDSIPTIRLAVELKVELFRNSSNTWTVNDLHDIDALSIAVPYCHVVVPDKAMADSLHRVGADRRHSTVVLRHLGELPTASNHSSNWHGSSAATGAGGNGIVPELVLIRFPQKNSFNAC